MSTFCLIVHNPFGGYQMGALISDPAEEDRVLASDHHAHVHRIMPVGSVTTQESAVAEKQV